MFFDDRLSQMQNNSHGDSNDAHESVSEDGYRLEYIAEVLDSNDFVDVSGKRASFWLHTNLSTNFITKLRCTETLFL